MVNVLLALSWLMSLAFVAMIGFGLGYRQANKDRVQFVETVKGAVFQLVEKVKSHAAKETHYLWSVHGVPGDTGTGDASEEAKPGV